MTIATETRMYAEASAAGDVVRQQLRLNGDRVAALARRLRSEPPQMVLTCARGSSDHAATFAKYLIETRLGVMTVSQAPSIASVYDTAQRIGRSLCLAISQSGKSPDILAAVGAAKESGAWSVAMVNAEDSPLAALCDMMLPLRAGPELSVAATKSYIAALAALAALVAAWSEDEHLAAAVHQAPDLLQPAWAADWSELVDGLKDTRGLYVVGRGLGLGIAQEAALKFKETCGIHAEAFSAAEIRHGPMALAGPDFPLLVFRQDDESAGSIDALVDEVSSRGGKVYVAGHRSGSGTPLPAVPTHPAVEPLLQIQSFYKAVNALSVARGFDPDRPPHLRKVTETV